MFENAYVEGLAVCPYLVFLPATHVSFNNRGLDFPAVDWVIQVDCPEDADTYIHRVGRTARYEAAGHALLFLLPSEEPGMIAALKNKRVPIEKIRVNPTRVGAVSAELRALCSRDPEIKYLGQKVCPQYACC